MIKIHHLNCVEIESPASGRAIGHCLLIEAENKMVLIDTGVGLKDTREPDKRIGKELVDLVGFRFNEEWTAIRQIERLGLDHKKVTDCVITHLDNDHISGLSDFPDAVVHVGTEEYENYKSGNLRYLHTPLSHTPVIKVYGQSKDQWYGFEARKIELDIETDIYFIPLFGHTYGHCGVAVRNKDKWLFYIGDAYYLKVELEDTPHPVNELVKMRADSDDLRKQTLDKIREFIGKHPEVDTFGYHDVDEFNHFVESE